jgi:iron complex outermembrane recepter protein
MRLKGVLAGSASVLAMLAVPAVAQSGAPAQSDSSQQIETVVVTGIRASVQRAIDIKRDSTAIVDAVSSEDIGKFPDKNVADSLERVPGVNTVSAASGEGGFDENDRVSIRGTNASLTQTVVDGHTIATGDWFILDQYQTIGRSVSYTLLPSEIVDTVKVYKSQQADLVEGGVAGVVDILTRKPLDFADDLTLEGSAEAAYTTLRAKTTPQLNALANWKDPTGTVGVMVQAFYEARDIRRDGQEFLGYSACGDTIQPGQTGFDNYGAANCPAAATIPALRGAQYPTLIGSALFLQQRVRQGANATVEIKPSDDFDLVLNGFYSHLAASNINNNYMFWGTNEFGKNIPSSYTIKDNTVVAAAFPALAGVAPIVADSIMRPGSGAETYYGNAAGTWKPAESYTVTFKLGYSHGVGKTDPQVAWEGEVAPTTGNAASYDFSSGVAAVSVPGVDTSNAANLINDWAWTAVSTANDSEEYAQADVQKDVAIGPIQDVKAGGRISDHARKAVLWDGGVSYAGSIGSDISTSNYPSNFADAFKIPGMLTDVPLGNTAEIENLLYNNTSWRSYPQSPAAVSNPANGRFDWQSSMNMKETDAALYAMADLGGQGWKGNFGVRVVKTDETIYQYVNSPTGTYSDFGDYAIDTIKHTIGTSCPASTWTSI